MNRHMNTRAALRALALAAAVAGSAWLSPALAGDEPPPIRVHRVGDMDATALADLRTQVQHSVEACRKMQHMPEAPPPALPDSQLSRITFQDSVTLFRADRIADFETTRLVVVDESSKCEPYVWAQRTATLRVGCKSHVSGNGPIGHLAYVPGLPPPSGPEFRSKPVDGRCPLPPMPVDLHGLAQIDAGGAPCVWHSALMWNRMSPQARAAAPQMNPGADGKTPAAKGDFCVYARRPNYESPLVQSEFVVLKTYLPHTHSIFNSASSRDVGYGTVLTHNTHLVEFREGAPISDAEVSEAAVQSFIQKNYRESLPADR